MSQETPPPPREPIDFQSAVKQLREKRRQRELQHDKELMDSMRDVIKTHVGLQFLMLRHSLKHTLLHVADVLHLRRGQKNQEN